MEQARLNIREEFLIEKFDGESDEGKKPVETIKLIYQDGLLVDKEIILHGAN